MNDYYELRQRYSMFLDNIMISAQLAAALEVSGWPKPGNVHRTSDFGVTLFEHFIAGSIALGPSCREAAFGGLKVNRGVIGLDTISIGNCINSAVTSINSWHRGGNTHLGTILLFMPVCAGAGYLGSVELMDPTSLRSATELVMKNTSTEDAINTYHAIMNSQVTGLGKLKESKYPDLTNQDATDDLISDKVTLYDVMEASANRDNISREWITGMEITFQTGYTTFQSTYEEFKNVNLSTVHTFLTILSKFPDTFIARRLGLKKTKFVEDAVNIGMNTAREISERATQVLKLGGLSTTEGKNAAIKFDEELKQAGTDMNPGTTADLTASSLLTVLLCGLRP